MKVVAFLPAKGSSSRIHNKNTRLLDGKPLFLYTLEKLERCDFIDEIYLDSESEEIFDMVDYIDCKFLKRDKGLATNKTDGHSLFFNEASKVEADIYVQILCTSPFIKPETIKKGIDILKNDNKYDSVVLMKKEKLYLWDNNGPIYDKFNIPNSVDLPDTIIETMGLYITRKSVATEKKMRFGERVYLLEAETIEAVDINYPDEFELANFIAAGIREKENKFLRNLAKHINSSMLSDILDDIGVTSVISGLQLNLQEEKMFGRAKTLKLRELKEDEDYRGIYKALDSYKSVVRNDIIVVENECSEFAYFGELNANLAIRAGASGVVVGGKTRDMNGVKKLGLPVFSKGGNCKDVRKRATTEAINKKIKINGIEIAPGDLIFGDIDGIVVIPRKYEKTVISMLTEKLTLEMNVVQKIALEMDEKEILDTIGEF